MAQNQQFLQDFQSSMDRLNGMNQMIQNSLQQKKTFSDKLIAKLIDVNQKIKNLAEQINRMKTTLDGLQGQVSNNTSSISDKDKKIAELTQRIAQLESEKQQIAQQLANFQKQCNDEKLALQQKINSDEGQIRKLMEDNEAMKKQNDALTAELTNKGDLPAQHAQQIKSQTEEFQKQMSQLQQENQSKIDELMAQIKDCDDKMLELQKQLKEKTDEAAAHAQSVTDTQNQGQTQIAQLNKQINDLKQENADLIQRIVAATQAIMQASDNLEKLANTVPNQQSEQYINKIFAEIEQSIQNISSIIQGRPVQSNSQINANKMITVQQSGGPSIQVPFNFILNELDRKGKQRGNPNFQNYINALDEMKRVQNENQVEPILRKYGITFKNGTIMGGRKTKKMYKQKGGFTYKNNTKRKSITTTSSRRKSSSKSSNSIY
jgi:chromosome segregation ATPase